jgi:hypothetical protein
MARVRLTKTLIDDLPIPEKGQVFVWDTEVPGFAVLHHLLWTCPGKVEIFNTDQGSQFTSPRFTGILTGTGIRVSMDGRGRWMDNLPRAYAAPPARRSLRSYRTAMAIIKIRMYVYPRIRDRKRSPRRNRTMDRLL